MRSQMAEILDNASLYNTYGTWRKLRREAWANEQQKRKMGRKTAKKAVLPRSKPSKAAPYAAGDTLEGYPSLQAFRLKTTEDVIKAHQEYFADPTQHDKYCSKLGGGSKCTCGG